LLPLYLEKYGSISVRIVSTFSSLHDAQLLWF
jgi:hypothetical protein